MVAGPPQPMAPPMQGQPLYAPSYVVPVSMTSMTPTVVQTTQQPRFDHRKRGEFRLISHKNVYHLYPSIVA